MAQGKIDTRKRIAACLATLRARIRDGIKWWAEHQAWPATDEIRIETHRRGCC